MGMTLEQIAMLEPTEEEVWAQARKDYEAGVGVGRICARYGLARSTVYQRAQLWRAEFGVIDQSLPRPKAADLADLAWRRLAQAVEAGRIQEALCWRTLTQTLEQRARKDAWDEQRKGLTQSQAVDALIAICDEQVADDKAMKAASLDTPPPTPPEDEEEVETCTPEEVRDWRAWAAYNQRILSQEGEAAMPTEEFEGSGAEWGGAGGGPGPGEGPAP